MAAARTVVGAIAARAREPEAIAMRYAVESTPPPTRWELHVDDDRATARDGAVGDALDGAKLRDERAEGRAVAEGCRRSPGRARRETDLRGLEGTVSGAGREGEREDGARVT